MRLFSSFLAALLLLGTPTLKANPMLFVGDTPLSYTWEASDLIQGPIFGNLLRTQDGWMTLVLASGKTLPCEEGREITPRWALTIHVKEPSLAVTVQMDPIEAVGIQQGGCPAAIAHAFSGQLTSDAPLFLQQDGIRLELYWEAVWLFGKEEAQGEGEEVGARTGASFSPTS